MITITKTNKLRHIVIKKDTGVFYVELQPQQELATGKTTAQMKTEGTFTDWDFTTPIWIMDLTNLAGYPNLKWYYDLLPAAPATPADLTNTVLTKSEATFTWSASATATSYKLYQDGVEAYSGADLTATITGLTPKTAYAFTVTALNAVGESAQSAAVNITTKSNTRPSRISLGIRLGL